ncbi:MAG: FliH/SctL family protein, partial [Alphaproteobacteria bacterium]
SLKAEAIDIGVAVATKLAQDLVNRYPMAEIRALVADCFANLRTVPHLVVRVHDDLLDDARTELTRLASERGFEGRLVIMAEPSIARGDCRIEWASGGIVVDRAETQNRIAEAVNRFLATPTSTPGVNHE